MASVPLGQTSTQSEQALQRLSIIKTGITGAMTGAGVASLLLATAFCGIFSLLFDPF
jgi:hypothetical protein